MFWGNRAVFLSMLDLNQLAFFLFLCVSDNCICLKNFFYKIFLPFIYIHIDTPYNSKFNLVFPHRCDYLLKVA